MKIAIAILLAVAVPAHADELAIRTTPRHAVSVQLTTLATSGIALQGERDLDRHKLSLAAAVGVRTAAHGDFDSLTLGAGIELRRWLRRPTAMRGLYVGARTDLARTSIHDEMEARAIGSVTTWSLGATLGYRFLIRNRVEITPAVGMGLVVESGSMAPATARGAGTVGLTAGVAF